MQSRSTPNLAAVIELIAPTAASNTVAGSTKAFDRFAVDEVEFPQFTQPVSVLRLPSEHPKKDLRALKNALSTRWFHNPRTYEGLAGYTLTQIRVCDLELTQRAFMRAAEIPTAAALEHLESGTARPISFQRLFAKLPQVVLERAGAETVVVVQRKIETMAELLAQAAGIAHPTNRLLFELSLLHGWDALERGAGIKARHLQHRMAMAVPGNFKDNVRAVQGMVSLLSGQTSDTQSLCDSWFDPRLQRCLAGEIEQRFDKLQGSGRELESSEALVELMLMLVELQGSRTSEALRKQFGLPDKIAIRMSRHELVDLSFGSKVLDKLQLTVPIPESVAQRIAKAWDELSAAAPVRTSADVSQRVREGLASLGLDEYKAAKLLGVQGHSPGTRLGAVLEATAFENRELSFHALCCLAAHSRTDAEVLLEACFDRVQRFPTHAGRGFSYLEQLRLQYNLTQEQIAAIIPGVHISKYANGDALVPATQCNALMALGDKRSISALAANCDLLCPANVADVLRAFELGSKTLTSDLAKAGTSLETFRRFEAKSSIVSWPQLRELLQQGQILEHPLLEVAWCLYAADRMQEAGASAIERALGVAMLRVGEDRLELYDHLAKSAGGTLRLNRTKFADTIKTCVQIARGNQRGSVAPYLNQLLPSFVQAGYSQEWISSLRSTVQTHPPLGRSPMPVCQIENDALALLRQAGARHAFDDLGQAFAVRNDLWSRRQELSVSGAAGVQRTDIQHKATQLMLTMLGCTRQEILALGAPK